MAVPGPQVRNDKMHMIENKTTSIRKRGNLPKESTSILKKWFISNRHNPYPTEREKLRLANEAKLTTLQVCNWFINARRRFTPELRERYGDIPDQYSFKRQKTIQKSLSYFTQASDMINDCHGNSSLDSNSSSRSSQGDNNSDGTDNCRQQIPLNVAGNSKDDIYKRYFKMKMGKVQKKKTRDNSDHKYSYKQYFSATIDSLQARFVYEELRKLQPCDPLHISKNDKLRNFKILVFTACLMRQPKENDINTVQTSLN